MNTFYASATEDWRAWLARNCQSEKEVWLVIHHSGSGTQNHGSQEQHEPTGPLLAVGFVAAGVYGFERLRLVGIRHGRSSSRASGAKYRSTSIALTSASADGRQRGAWSLSISKARIPS